MNEGFFKYTYKTVGTCSKEITVELDPDTKIIHGLSFKGGCQGNLAALSRMLNGMHASDIIEMFKGSTCGIRETSCVDQLTKCLTEALTHLATRS